MWNVGEWVGGRRRLRTVQHLDRPVHRGQGVQARLLDAFQSEDRLRGIGGGDEAGRLGLDDDPADVVGDEVVQIAGELKALGTAGLGHRAPATPFLAAGVGAGPHSGDRGKQPEGGDADGFRKGLTRDQRQRPQADRESHQRHGDHAFPQRRPPADHAQENQQNGDLRQLPAAP